MHEAGHDDGCTIMHPSDKDEKDCKADLVIDLYLDSPCNLLFIETPKLRAGLYCMVGVLHDVKPSTQITDGGCVWCTLPKWEGEASTEAAAAAAGGAGLAVKQHACWSAVHAKTDPSFSALPPSHLAETRKKLKCSN